MRLVQPSTVLTFGQAATLATGLASTMARLAPDRGAVPAHGAAAQCVALGAVVEVLTLAGLARITASTVARLAPDRGAPPAHSAVAQALRALHLVQPVTC